MRGLGLINERVQEDHAAYGIPPNPRHVNLPYPGVFVLDRDGVITDKRFFESYRERETGGGLIAQALGIFTEPSAPIAVAAEPVLTARAWLDSPTYAFFQRLALTIEVSITSGFHVYGKPAGQGLTPLSLEIDPIPGLEVGPARWPAPRRFDRTGFHDGPWVHEGVVRGTVPLTFAAAPGGGDHVLGVTVHYQACDDASCLVPSSLRLRIPVREAPLVGRSLPGPPEKA
jgi:DsbC/DsbD-like thiol-disulfide interchange protein